MPILLSLSDRGQGPPPLFAPLSPAIIRLVLLLVGRGDCWVAVASGAYYNDDDDDSQTGAWTSWRGGAGVEPSKMKLMVHPNSSRVPTPPNTSKCSLRSFNKLQWYNSNAVVPRHSHSFPLSSLPPLIPRTPTAAMP